MRIDWEESRERDGEERERELSDLLAICLGIFCGVWVGTVGSEFWGVFFILVDAHAHVLKIQKTIILYL